MKILIKNGLIVNENQIFESDILVNGELIAIDEIHTPDSSRFWVKEEYESRFNAGQSQKMLDKENIRQWLIEQGFSGEGTPPDLSDEIRISLSEHYM